MPHRCLWLCVALEPGHTDTSVLAGREEAPKERAL